MSATAAQVSARLQDVATVVDRELERVAGERLGFILLVWAGGEVSYVGTDNDRARVAKAMRELIAKWEAGASAIPAHERQ